MSDSCIMPLHGGNGSQTTISELTNELNSYAKLKDGWDGNGSRQPNQKYIIFARSLIDSFNSSIPLPKLMLLTNGDIGFYWNNDGIIADIEIDSSGDFFSFFAKSSKSKKEVFVTNIKLDAAQEKITRAYKSL